ncbi:hypothetical protein [Streptomyces sp. NBC_00306]|uniref:hypothetical protein n=1 Tax=Streptomyces sp. NBC_00306 TaxID=2975708 RepID=UPI002E2A4CD5|nr:hypothetical protein [Streptomyces sp. NBC_00306]
MSGIDATSLDVIKGFYDGIFQTTITVSGTKVAEVAKLIENIFRFVNISMDNEMAMPAASLGVNVWESFTPPQPIPSSRGFTPGRESAGTAYPSTNFLSWKIQLELGVPLRVELADDVNRRMPDYVVRRLVEAFDKRLIPL